MFNPVPYYRLARWLHLRGIPLLPRIIEKLSFLVFHCYIPYQAEIGEGCEVGYWGVGVVIHPRVKMGRNVFVSNGVTIGGRNELWGVPRIEDDVFIATGAKVLGDVTVGHGSIIGANAVVIRSVPPRCIAVGVPARISRENVDVRDYTGWPKSLPTHSVQSTTSNSATPSKPTARIFHMVNSLEMGGSEHQMVEVASRPVGKRLPCHCWMLVIKGSPYRGLEARWNLCNRIQSQRWALSPPGNLPVDPADVVFRYASIRCCPVPRSLLHTTSCSGGMACPGSRNPFLPP